jgi:hypothetical protein
MVMHMDMHMHMHIHIDMHMDMSINGLAATNELIAISTYNTFAKVRKSSSW